MGKELRKLQSRRRRLSAKRRCHPLHISALLSLNNALCNLHLLQITLFISDSTNASEIMMHKARGAAFCMRSWREAQMRLFAAIFIVVAIFQQTNALSLRPETKYTLQIQGTPTEFGSASRGTDGNVLEEQCANRH